MITRFRIAFRRHPVLSSLFLLAAFTTVFFAVRLVVHSVYWADPVHRDQAIAGWMTPGYVAHSWQVPGKVLGDAIGVTKDEMPPGQTLAQLAQQEDIPLDALIKDLDAAIIEFRSTHD